MPSAARLASMRRAWVLASVGIVLLATGCAAPQESAGGPDRCMSPNETSAYYDAGTNASCPPDELPGGSSRETVEDDGAVPSS